MDFFNIFIFASFFIFFHVFMYSCLSQSTLLLLCALLQDVLTVSLFDFSLFSLLKLFVLSRKPIYFLCIMCLQLLVVLWFHFYFKIYRFSRYFLAFSFIVTGWWSDSILLVSLIFLCLPMPLYLHCCSSLLTLLLSQCILICIFHLFFYLKIFDAFCNI